MTDPIRDVIEYIKRDIANVALGNKDNHATLATAEKLLRPMGMVVSAVLKRRQAER